MANNPVNDDALEDVTDELPILLETAVLDPAEHRVATLVSVGGDETGEHAAFGVEETGEHTALFAAPLSGRDDALETLQADLRSREVKIAALEQDIAQLSVQWQDVERHLNERSRTIGELEREIAALRRELAARTAAEQPPATDDTELQQKLEQAHADAAALRRELAAASAAREAAEQTLAAAQASQASRPSESSANVQTLREEVAALSDYIGARRGFWNELEARATAASARVKNLERELAQREKRQRQTEALAERESARAESARSTLIEKSRACEALERELRMQRTAATPALQETEELRAELASTAAVVLELRAQLAAAEGRAADAEHAARAAEQAAEDAAAQRRLAAESAAAAVPRAEEMARLEAELEQRRQEIAAQGHELAEREQRLAAASTDLERTRGELAKARAELDEKRTDMARLERALVEKDRALQARDQRVATLQNELEEKLGALHRLNAMDLSLQGLNSKIADRLARTESAAEGTPSLVCISGNEPQHYALGKNTMTIGRGSQCDIQILTHFVSREHARLTVSRAGVLIEDLGSTNGVFVNSIRVDRQELRHSDLVTIGETQFRFLETMAH